MNQQTWINKHEPTNMNQHTWFNTNEAPNKPDPVSRCAASALAPQIEALLSKSVRKIYWLRPMFIPWGFFKDSLCTCIAYGHRVTCGVCSFIRFGKRLHWCNCHGCVSHCCARCKKKLNGSNLTKVNHQTHLNHILSWWLSSFPLGPCSDEHEVWLHLHGIL